MRSIILAAVLAVAGISQAAEVSITWQDKSDLEDGFRIERREYPTGAFSKAGQVGKNVTQYKDVGAVLGMTYCYRVIAFNAVATSAPSNEACMLVKPGQLVIVSVE